jgi:hypothetical protein
MRNSPDEPHDRVGFDVVARFDRAMRGWRPARSESEYARQVRRSIRRVEYELFEWAKAHRLSDDHQRRRLAALERSALDQWRIRRWLALWGIRTWR